MTIGSRKRKPGGGLDARTPAIWISNGTGRDGIASRNAPKIGWCWAGNRHTWLGFASSSGRRPLESEMAQAAHSHRQKPAPLRIEMRRSGPVWSISMRSMISVRRWSGSWAACQARSSHASRAFRPDDGAARARSA